MAFQARLAEERPAQLRRALLVAALVIAWLLLARGTPQAWRGPVAGLSTLFLVVVLFIGFGRYASFSGWGRSTLHAAGLSAACTALALWLNGESSMAHAARAKRVA